MKAGLQGKPKTIVKNPVGKQMVLAPFCSESFRKILWPVVWDDAISIIISVHPADWTYGSSPTRSKIKSLNVHDGDF